MIYRDIQSLVDDYYQHYHGRSHSNLESKKKFSFHFKLESLFAKLDKFPIVLELGAGKLDHCKFVKLAFEVYLSTDIRTIEIKSMPEIDPGLIPNQRGSYKSKDDARELVYSTNSLKRIVT